MGNGGRNPTGFIIYHRLVACVRQRHILILGGVVLLVLAAGCMGIGGDDGDDGGDGASADWCEPSQMSMTQTQGIDSESASVSVNGIVERDGRQVCHIAYEFADQPGYASADFYFSEDDSYFQAIYYDADGNVVQSVDMSQSVGDTGGTTTGGDDGMTDDGGGATDGTGGTGSASWCETSAVSMTQVQGLDSESASVTVHGLTQRDGRQVCQVTYDYPEGQSQYGAVEFFFTENNQYFHLVYYDHDGNVIREVDVT